MKFRKKPVVIEAVQYEGNGNLNQRHNGEVPQWLWDAFAKGTVHVKNGDDPLIIKTLEGDHKCKPGDWIIQGVKGELYPCKPDIFDMTYEPVGIKAATKNDEKVRRDILKEAATAIEELSLTLGPSCRRETTQAYVDAIMKLGEK